MSKKPIDPGPIREKIKKQVATEKTATDVLTDRQAAYRIIFAEGTAAKAVLLDLGVFCRERESCFHVDPRAHAVLEGRREVMLRIRDYLELSVEELLLKYGNKRAE